MVPCGPTPGPKGAVQALLSQTYLISKTWSGLHACCLLLLDGPQASLPGPAAGLPPSPSPELLALQWPSASLALGTGDSKRDTLGWRVVVKSAQGQTSTQTNVFLTMQGLGLVLTPGGNRQMPNAGTFHDSRPAGLRNNGL